MSTHNWTAEEHARIVRHGIALWGRTRLRKWLHEPTIWLSDRRPIDCTYREVFNVIDQYEFALSILGRVPSC